jgi:hypothetical protein
MDDALKALSNLALKKISISYPNVPSYALPATRYSDKTSNGLTKCIIDFLNLTGAQAERINNTGRVLDNRIIVKDVLGGSRSIGSTKWIPGTGKNGTADISATIKGRSIKVEVKIGADKQSDQQKEYQKEVEAAGGIYFIAKDFNSFYNWIKPGNKKGG